MSSPQQESFQSMATVFILQDKTWIERGSGLVRFVFDLRTFALRLVIRPGTPDEFECKLRPRIRSKGPRAYVVRAQAENGTDEHILAVRFEREEDSRSFRRFVEKRDVDHNSKNQSSSNNQNPSNYPSHLRNQTDYTNNSGIPNNKYIDPMTAAVQQQYHRGNRTSSNIAQGGYGSYPSQAHAIRAQQQAQQNGTYLNNTGMYGSPNNQIQSPSNGQQQQQAQAQGGGGKGGGGGQAQGNGGGGGQVSANYFWTCSRCLQMVDPSLTSCHVCGTLRQENPNANNPNYHPQQSNPNGIQNASNVLQQINAPNNQSPYVNNPHSAQQHGGHPSHAHVVHNPHASNSHSGHHTNLASYGSNVHHQIRNPASLTHSTQNQHSYTHNSHHPSHSGSHGTSSHPQPVQQPNVHILKLTTVNLEKHNKLFPPKRRNVKEVVQQQLEWLRTHQ